MLMTHTHTHTHTHTDKQTNRSKNTTSLTEVMRVNYLLRPTHSTNGFQCVKPAVTEFLCLKTVGPDLTIIVCILPTVAEPILVDIAADVWW